VPSDNAPFDVAVVGSGVVGLTAALGCAQQGMRVVLVGPAPRPWVATPDLPFDPRVYALAPSSVDLLDSVRAWPQIDRQREQAITRMEVFADAGGSICFSAFEAGVERLATIVEEGELLRILWLACGFAPTLVHLGATFEAVTAGAESAMLRLSGGHTVSARLLLGADGRNSAVRAACGFNTTEKPHGQTALVGNFTCEQPHRGVAYQWFSAEGVLALLPLPGDHVSLVWSAPEALAKDLLALSAEHFADRIGARTGMRLGRLGRLGGVHAFALSDLRIDRIVQPRVALLGDCAHVVHPLAGQGLNLGLQDVSKLLEVLAARETWRDPGDYVLLRRHERARAEPVGMMRSTVNSLARLFASSDPVLARLRNVGMSLVGSIAPLKSALVRRAMG